MNRKRKVFGIGYKRGIEISSTGIRWVEVKYDGVATVIACSAIESIPEGLVVPSFAKENIEDKKSLKDHIINAIPAGKRRGDIALSLPDQLTRINLLEFDDIPEKRDEVEKLILWRLKKSLPLPTEMIKVGYNLLGDEEGRKKVLSAAASIAVLREYEDIVREIGLRPKVVNISSLNAITLFQNKFQKYSIYVDVIKNSLGITVVVDGQPVFFRCKELDGDMKKVEKEVLSTLTYYRREKPDLPITNLYLRCCNENAGDIADSLQSGFDGDVLQLKVSELLQSDPQSNQFEELAPTIGAALNLQGLK